MRLEKITIRSLNTTLFSNFNRHQLVTYVWREASKANIPPRAKQRMIGTERQFGDYFLVSEAYTEDWSSDMKAEIVKKLVDKDRVSYAAVDREKIVGVISMQKDKYGNRMILDMLYVDESARRHGVGKKLFEKAKELANSYGAYRIYVISSPPLETVAFFKEMGCFISKDPIPKFTKQYPLSIPLECEIY